MRHQLWLAILVVATIAFTLVFACAAPFAAFGAAAALTLSRRDALLATVALWLVDQAAGYLIVGYPWTLHSVAWGQPSASRPSSELCPRNGRCDVWLKRETSCERWPR